MRQYNGQNNRKIAPKSYNRQAEVSVEKSCERQWINNVKKADGLSARLEYIQFEWLLLVFVVVEFSEKTSTDHPSFVLCYEWRESWRNYKYTRTVRNDGVWDAIIFGFGFVNRKSLLLFFGNIFHQHEHSSLAISFVSHIEIDANRPVSLCLVAHIC